MNNEFSMHIANERFNNLYCMLLKRIEDTGDLKATDLAIKLSVEQIKANDGSSEKGFVPVDIT